jgi:hypothetical protein
MTFFCGQRPLKGMLTLYWVSNGCFCYLCVIKVFVFILYHIGLQRVGHWPLGWRWWWWWWSGFYSTGRKIPVTLQQFLYLLPAVGVLSYTLFLSWWIWREFIYSDSEIVVVCVVKYLRNYRGLEVQLLQIRTLWRVSPFVDYYYLLLLLLFVLLNEGVFGGFGIIPGRQIQIFAPCVGEENLLERGVSWCKA